MLLALRVGAVAMVLGSFFFSSRRRHTRFDCDWSSDVCSSDLRKGPGHSRKAGNETARGSASTAAARSQGPAEKGKQNPASDRSTVRTLSARGALLRDRKSTRLNSSHSQISYAVFCLKKKKSTGFDQSAGRTTPMRSRSRSIGHVS